MNHLLVTTPIELHDCYYNKVKTLDPNLLSQRVVLGICDGYKKNINGKIFFEQRLNINPRDPFSSAQYLISLDVIKANKGLIKLLPIDPTKKYRTLMDTKGHDNSYNMPSPLAIKEGSIIKYRGNYATRRGDCFFNIEGMKGTYASRELNYSAAPEGTQYYNPLMLEVFE